MDLRSERSAGAVPPLCQGPNPSPRTPRFSLPHGTTDSHFHFYGPDSRYPYAPNRSYTPRETTPEMARKFFQTLGISRAVAIQPSIYGLDNSCQLDGAAALGIECRVVVVVPPTITDRELVLLHDRGARGVRFILTFPGSLSVNDLELFGEKLKGLGWHLAITLDPGQLEELAPRLAKLPINVVFDHFAFIRPDTERRDKAIDIVLGLLRSGNCWMKLSAQYRLSSVGTPYADMTPLARSFVTAAPDRVVWGSDWPHGFFQGDMMNSTDLLDVVPDWVPDDKTMLRLLVDNPTKLYGFEQASQREEAKC